MNKNGKKFSDLAFNAPTTFFFFSPLSFYMEIARDFFPILSLVIFSLLHMECPWFTLVEISVQKKKQKKKLHKYLWLCKAHNEYHVIEHVVLFTKIPVGLFFTILICLLNMHIAKIGGKTCTDYLAIVCCLFFFSSHPRSLTSMNVLNVDTSFANKKFMLHNPLMS